MFHCRDEGVRNWKCTRCDTSISSVATAADDDADANDDSDAQQHYLTEILTESPTEKDDEANLMNRGSHCHVGGMHAVARPGDIDIGM